MTDDEIRQAAVGVVDAVKYEPTDEEIAAAISEIEAERDGEDRSGE